MAVPTPDAGAGASAGSVAAANPLDQLAGSLTGTRNPTPAGTSTRLPAKKAPAKKAPATKAAPRSAPTASRSRPVASASGMTVDAFLSGIRQYESGGNYKAKNPGSSASGAYQYLDSSWNNYGGYRHASDAPQSVQDARARADALANLKKYGGDWRKVAAAHFAGSGWVDKHPDPATWDQNPVPGSNNPTVAQYVASVFKNSGIATDSSGHPVPSSTATAGQVANGSTPAGTDGALPANATPKQINDYIAKHYGYLAAFLADPQIGPILRKAAKNDWSEEDLTGAITATNWWKTHSDSMRQWDSLNRLDPAKAKGQLTSMMATLREQAVASGVTLVGLQLHDMAVNALRMGWNSAQISEALRAQGKQTSTGVQTQFGPYAALAATNPEVKGILDQAVKAGWSQQQFETALSQTNWWKTTNSTARQVQLGQVSDPATTRQQQTLRHDQIVQLARNLGIADTDPNVAKIAQDAFVNGWDDPTVTRKLADLVHVDPTGKNSGQTAVTVGNLKQQAADYMIKLSDPTVQDWTRRILRGDTTTAAFEEYLKQQAKILRPWAAKQIDAGFTMGQITDSYKQLVASTLELSPDQVDFTNARFAPILDGQQQPGATGTDAHGPMSLSQAGAYLRNLPEYKQTAQANQQGADFVVDLTKQFGKLAV